MYTNNQESLPMKVPKLRMRRLSAQMTLYFSIVIIISYVLTVLLISNLFADRLMQEMDSVLNRKMSLINNTLSNAIEQIDRLYISILNDSDVRRHAAWNSDEEKQQAAAFLQEHLSSYARHN